MDRRRQPQGESLTRKRVTFPASPGPRIPVSDYSALVSDISGLLEQARRTVARSINGVLTATYWEIGRRIVEYEQKRQERTSYGERLLARLSHDLAAGHGRGFSERNIEQMRAFYLGWEISQTPSAKFEARAKCQTLSGISEAKKQQTPSAKSRQAILPVPASISQEFVPTGVFPLSWSHYVRLISVENPQARAFCESEAIRGSWSVRQLDRGYSN